MAAAVDITGQKFGRLTAIECLERVAGRGRKWLFRCECGGVIMRFPFQVTSGNTSSCGCIRKEMLIMRNKESLSTHRMTGTTEHTIWAKMIQRCRNPNDKNFPSYGGRGIKVCDRWNDPVTGFQEFFNDMGMRPKGAQIDRTNNNGNYEPSNCRWVTPKQNSRNRRSNKMIDFRNETKCIAQWVDELGIERKSLGYRLKNQTIEKALTTPYFKRKAYNYVK